MTKPEPSSEAGMLARQYETILEQSRTLLERTEAVIADTRALLIPSDDTDQEIGGSDG